MGMPLLALLVVVLAGSGVYLPCLVAAAALAAEVEAVEGEAGAEEEVGTAARRREDR